MAEQEAHGAPALAGSCRGQGENTIADAEAALAAAAKARDGAARSGGPCRRMPTRDSARSHSPTTTGTRWLRAGRGGSQIATIRRTGARGDQSAWMRHFVAPPVPTVFDFGPTAKPPTHPNPARLARCRTDGNPQSPPREWRTEEIRNSEFGIRSWKRRAGPADEAYPSSDHQQCFIDSNRRSPQQVTNRNNRS